MKKSKWLVLFAIIVVVVMSAIALTACASSKDIKDSEYLQAMENLTLENGEKLFKNNTTANDIPQTAMHKIVMDHLKAPLPSGKTQKKVLFMGYDGYRPEGLANIMNNGTDKSAVMNIRAKGGLWFSYSGGAEGGTTQATSTAPSWCAMLTGGWANYNGINDNGQVKSADIPTFLEKAMDMGLSASFTTSWREHTSTTYREDIIKHTSKGYPVVYKHGGDDEATLYTMLEYTSMPKSGDGNGFDPDVMFFTFEHADHAGHGSGFGNWNENYVKETKKCDEYGMAILNSIYGRESYEQEDWLIIIVTDHGGKGTNHGGQSLRERTTWFACNKAELVNADELKNFAIPPKSSIVQG